MPRKVLVLAVLVAFVTASVVADEPSTGKPVARDATSTPAASGKGTSSSAVKRWLSEAYARIQFKEKNDKSSPKAADASPVPGADAASAGRAVRDIKCPNRGECDFVWAT